MNGKIAKRIRQAIKDLPAMSEEVTIITPTLGKDLPIDYIKANPGKFKPKSYYKYKTVVKKPIDHEARAKAAYQKNGMQGVADYVADMKKAKSVDDRRNAKAGVAEGNVEQFNKDQMYV